VLVPFAKRILADIETARLQVHELAELRQGRLRLGATPSLCTGLLAHVLAGFRVRYAGAPRGSHPGYRPDPSRAAHRRCAAHH
jgi:DNA-binding transcriptional LysR family regulator